MEILKNSKGYAVESLQEMLKELGYYRDIVSGEYDEKTASAVREFQKDNGLDPNGNAYERTLVIIAMKSAIVN